MTDSLGVSALDIDPLLDDEQTYSINGNRFLSQGYYRYGRSINLGVSGLQSRSRGSSGSFTSFASPIALRLIEKVCAVDLNGDGIVDFADYLEFLNLFDAQDLRVDFNHDGIVDFADYLEFLNLFDAGC